ncbi:MAG: hypothetical protein AABZ53_02110 [Planctomycetota bacterium]
MSTWAHSETHLGTHPAIADGSPGTRANVSLLGAAVAIVLGTLGFAVPLAALACRSVMVGLAQPLAPPTRMVIGFGWWWVLAAVLIAGGLLAKEYRVGQRRALLINASALVLGTILAAMALLAVIMPLISVGNSLTGPG